MRLIPAYGSLEMQEAHKSRHVDRIAALLYYYLENDIEYFLDVASFLRDFRERVSEPFPLPFTQRLQDLRDLRARPGPDGNPITSPYVDELIQLITEMYKQDQEKLGFQRGAIVESFAYRLVGSRCGNGECFLNHRLLDDNPIFDSQQIDVIVRSWKRKQIEGYSCKVKPDNLKQTDCVNLIKLEDYGLAKGFGTHLGVVGFDSIQVAKQKLRQHQRIPYEFKVSIKAYGLENIPELRQNPFIPELRKIPFWHF